jgi:hypothetical protein
MQLIRVARALAVTLGVAVLVAGCGDDKKSGPKVEGKEGVELKQLPPPPSPGGPQPAGGGKGGASAAGSQ